MLVGSPTNYYGAIEMLVGSHSSYNNYCAIYILVALQKNPNGVIYRSVGAPIH